MSGKAQKTRQDIVSACREEALSAKAGRELTAKEARNLYHRNWAKTHPENVRDAQARYWAKVAKEISETANDAERKD